MKTKYLAYAQAYAMSQDYQHLSGEPFNDDYRIDFVTIAPYSPILQWQFVRNILSGENPNACLRKYPGDRYDVIVVSKCRDSLAGFLIKDLRTYLEVTGTFFNSVRYNCLRSCRQSDNTIEHILTRPHSRQSI